ncbi:MAG: hypothetical protein LH679_23285 [Cyanobacteria bacterium CAN_BIN43]|nr:hypothetical protein [Cyanobacteria bacterium CAN_BIN43]
MTLYFTGATLVFGILLNAFLKDSSTPKSDVTSWLVVLIGTLVWPLVLPSMILKQLPKRGALKLKYTN